jgi:ubiquinone/menaquinone biosynthesis C-methylase UbiE
MWLQLNQFEFPVVECLKCKLVYVNPRPVFEDMIHFYPSSFYSCREGKEWENKYKIEMSFMPDLSNETILDIGCAAGGFLDYLKQHNSNIDIYGVDAFSNSVTSNKIKFYNTNLKSAEFKDSMFDIITAWAVFEHLHDPAENFEEVYRILKRGGKFIFLVTNSNSLYGKVAYAEDIPRHLYHFSPLTLRFFAQKYGFTLSGINYDNRIWDGRGKGTFYHLLQTAAGVSWQKRFLNETSMFQKAAGHIGKKMDHLFFSSNWEARMKRSGIMIVQFEK